jgi:maleamate amidohydrolase
MTGWNEAAHRHASAPRVHDAAALERSRRSGDILDGVKPIPGEVVLRKTAPGAFRGTPPAAHRTCLNADTLIVAGENTNGCVRASVVEKLPPVAAAFKSWKTASLIDTK